MSPPTIDLSSLRKATGWLNDAQALLVAMAGAL